MGNQLQKWRAPPPGPEENERNHPLYYDWTLPKWSPFKTEKCSSNLKDAAATPQPTATGFSSTQTTTTTQTRDANDHLKSNLAAGSGYSSLADLKQALKEESLAKQTTATAAAATNNNNNNKSNNNNNNNESQQQQQQLLKQSTKGKSAKQTLTTGAEANRSGKATKSSLNSQSLADGKNANEKSSGRAKAALKSLKSVLTSKPKDTAQKKPD